MRARASDADLTGASFLLHTLYTVVNGTFVQQNRKLSLAPELRTAAPRGVLCTLPDELHKQLFSRFDHIIVVVSLSMTRREDIKG